MKTKKEVGIIYGWYNTLTNICYYCQGKIHYTNGFIWKYAS